MATNVSMQGGQYWYCYRYAPNTGIGSDVWKYFGGIQERIHRIRIF